MIVKYIEVSSMAKEWTVSFLQKDTVKFREFEEEAEARKFHAKQKAGCAALWQKVTNTKAKRVEPPQEPQDD